MPALPPPAGDPAPAATPVLPDWRRATAVRYLAASPSRDAACSVASRMLANGVDPAVVVDGLEAYLTRSLLALLRAPVAA